MDSETYAKYYNKYRDLNQNYPGSLKSITLVAKNDDVEKKIFKWFFKANSPDFYIAFPYFSAGEYYCGKITIPKGVKRLETFDAVNNGIPSKSPVKFSYHQDGNIHFKPTKQQLTGYEKAYKLAEISVPSLDKLNGNHIFTISFEGLDKFMDLEKHRTVKGHLESILPIPNGVKGGKLVAYAGPTLASISNIYKKNSDPWFTTQVVVNGQMVYVGIYAILHTRSYIKDDIKNSLVVFVGFD
ncbi:hypothetical protein HQ584_02905, partial [Patescibacteria group bacterium]|nr:hypothetical protein [Patescibacteria group bacterium]